MSKEPRTVVVDSSHRDSAAARGVTAEFLKRHCVWADRDAVLLVVAELTANAARHTAGWWRLRLTAEGAPGEEALTVELDDSSPAAPVARPPDFRGGGGFGWPMVLRLAGEVEVRPLAQGKRVRAVWQRPSRGVPTGVEVC